MGDGDFDESQLANMVARVGSGRLTGNFRKTRPARRYHAPFPGGRLWGLAGKAQQLFQRTVRY